MSQKPTVFVHGGQSPTFFGAGAQPQAGGVVVTQPALLAALRGEPAPSAPTPSAPQQPPKFFETPSGIGAGMIKSATDPNNAVGSTLEGVGRMAQLVSGHYLQGKERSSEGDRHRAAAGIIERHMGPELGALYAASDEDGRKALMAQTREHISKLHNDTRELRKTKEGAALLEGISTAREFEDRLLSSNNTEFVRQGLAAKLKRLELEAGPNSKVEYRDGVIIRTDKRTGEVLSVEEPRLPSTAAGSASPRTGGVVGSGAGPNTAPTPPSPGGPSATNDDPKARLSALHPDHVDSWESATTPSRQKSMFDVAMKQHHESGKQIRESATSAKRGLVALLQVEAALDRGAQTGAFAEYGLQLRKMGAALGLEIGEGGSDQEIIQSVANELAKSARAGYPGSVSNFEMQTYLRSVPSLGNSHEGNRLLIDGMKRLLQRQVDVEGWALDFMRQRREAGREGIIAEGFQSYASARAEAAPMFRAEELERMSQPGGGLDVATGGKAGAPQMSRVDRAASDALKGQPDGAYEIGGRTVYWQNGRVVGSK